jgi:alginate O-acetyltransferase complex protein AlgF
MKKWFAALTFALTGLVAAGAHADDHHATFSAAPEGSAYVRFLNDGAKGDPSKPSILGKVYEEVAFGKVGEYHLIAKGKADLEFAGAKASETFDSGDFYTAVLDGDKLEVIKDTKMKEPTKEQINFYNVSDKKLTLKTADGATEIADAGAGKHEAKEFDALPATLAVFDGDKKVADVEMIKAEGKAPLDIVALKKADGSIWAGSSWATADAGEKEHKPSN